MVSLDDIFYNAITFTRYDRKLYQKDNIAKDYGISSKKSKRNLGSYSVSLFSSMEIYSFLNDSFA